MGRSPGAIPGLKCALLVLVLGCSLRGSAGAPALCFEKVSDTKAIFLAEHPAGGSLVMATQAGMISLHTRPKVGKGVLATRLGTFLDLSNRIWLGYERGLLSFAFHPQFLSNGRFFISYTCDGLRFPECQGPCACSPQNDCQGGDQPCRVNSIVAEYKANGNPKNATSLNATEVRRVIKFGRTSSSHIGGHIWFGNDGYLFFSSGDGKWSPGSPDPFRTAQNGKVPQGKILRVDVDNLDPGTPYKIPPDNPFVNTTGVMPEIFVLGLRNPWRCSVEPKTGFIFCGDCGEDSVEEINILKKGGNYGWSYYEGLQPRNPNPPKKPIGGTFQPPWLQYFHPVPNAPRCVLGGYVYRANRNNCLKGQYVYSDVFNFYFLGTAFASKTAPTYQNISYSIVGQQQFASDDMQYSWAVDNSNELYRLSSSGVHRVTDATACGFTC